MLKTINRNHNSFGAKLITTGEGADPLLYAYRTFLTLVCTSL